MHQQITPKRIIEIIKTKGFFKHSFDASYRISEILISLQKKALIEPFKETLNARYYRAKEEQQCTEK